jgi:putative glutathione S-transferase
VIPSTDLGHDNHHHHDDDDDDDVIIGKYTVPVLWDKKTSRIVNNESALIVRMFNSEFSEWTTGSHKDIDLYPPHLHTSIDSVNDWVT